MNVGPRIEFSPDHYPRIRVWDPRAGRDRFVYLHRCVAYAHGEIDSLFAGDDGEHVHHIDADGWNNRPENLEAVDPMEHAEIEPHVANLR